MRRLSLLIVLVMLALNGVALAQEKSRGLIFLDDNAYRSIPLATTPLMGDIPPNADLSSSFPSPGDQGHQGSCVAWAVSYALKSYQEGVERHWDLTQNSHLFSPSFIYNQIKQSSSCEGGSQISDALNLLRQQGVAPLSDFAYDDRQCSKMPDAAVKQSARQYAIADWRRVNVQDEMEVKTQIASGFPVVIGMVVDNAFQSLRHGQIYSTPDGLNAGGHAMVVVGYDDSRNAFKVINSWGKSWGDNGFGWIDYKTFKNSVREGYVAQDIVTNPPSPNPAPTPPITPPAPPSPAIAAVTLGTPTIVHNIPVPGFGAMPGMRIIVPGQVTGGVGHALQIVVHFTYYGGPPLLANPNERTFRDVSGLVATGTPSTPIGTDDEDLSSVQIMIPYYALNFPPNNGFGTYNLAIVVMAYLDGQIAAQSPPVPFVLRW